MNSAVHLSAAAAARVLTDACPVSHTGAASLTHGPISGGTVPATVTATTDHYCYTLCPTVEDYPITSVPSGLL